MPRRTNRLQKLVRLLQHQLADVSATISESRMVKDRIDGEEVEVDILIEGTSHGLPITVGFEVRDSRPKKKQRKIDRNEAIAIFGKYRDLVDKIVVVSRSGFTRRAAKYLSMRGVVAVNFTDAVSRDWGSFFEQFEKLFFVSHGVALGGPPRVEYTCLDHPFRALAEHPIPTVTLPDGQQGALGAVIGPLINNEQAKQMISSKWYAMPEATRPTRFKEVVRYQPKPETPWLLEQEGTRYRLDAIEIPVDVTAHGKSFELAPMQYDDRKVMAGSVTMPPESSIREFHMVVSEGPAGDRRATAMVDVAGQDSTIATLQLAPNGT